MAQSNTKRLIQLSREQEEKMAAQAAQKVQNFVQEAAMIQGRRCEVMVALLAAQVTHAGVDALSESAIEKCRLAAHLAVAADARQKWSDLKLLFEELGINGPQPHLEWAAKQAGVTLFDAQPEESPIIQVTAVLPSNDELTKVVQ